MNWSESLIRTVKTKADSADRAAMDIWDVEKLLVDIWGIEELLDHPLHCNVVTRIIRGMIAIVLLLAWNITTVLFWGWVTWEPCTSSCERFCQSALFADLECCFNSARVKQHSNFNSARVVTNQSLQVGGGDGVGNSCAAQIRVSTNRPPHSSCFLKWTPHALSLSSGMWQSTAKKNRNSHSVWVSHTA